jgi:hypothetical protein
MEIQHGENRWGHDLLSYIFILDVPLFFFLCHPLVIFHITMENHPILDGIFFTSTFMGRRNTIANCNSH